ncbi:MAG: hypothetical protein RIE58_05640 [Vicingaceae bacterium]
MGKQHLAILEMIYHIERMKDSDKVALVQFLGKYRSNKTLVNVFRSLENALPGKPYCGVLKTVLEKPNSAAYKNFHRFRKKLFEFELTVKRLDSFRRYDPQSFFHITLKKEILAAEMLTQRNAYKLSIQLLRDTLKRAEQYEYLDLQSDCLRDLVEFSRISGRPRLEAAYNKEHFQIKGLHAQFEELRKKFEDGVFGMRCCAFHLPVMIQNADQAYVHFNTKHQLKKIEWMGKFLKAKEVQRYYNYQESLFLCTRLKREMNRHPGLCPAFLRVTLHILVLENLWYLKKMQLIEKYSKKLLRLDHVPTYQRIPVLLYFLHYFLWIQRFEMIELILLDLKRENAYSHFKEFMARAQLIHLATLFMKNQFTELLIFLNRQNLLTTLQCEHLNFDVRSMEILALKANGEENLLEDKLESLRRFVSRQASLKNDNYAHAFSEIVQKGRVIPQKHLPLFHHLMASISVYDLRWLTIQGIVEAYAPEQSIAFKRYSINYKLRLQSQALAAEP